MPKLAQSDGDEFKVTGNVVFGKRFGGVGQITKQVPLNDG